MNEIEAAAREFLPDVEALLDWMNGCDVSADHAADKPEEFKKLCRSLERMQAAIRA
jgi:hypothetical protein